MMDLGEAELLGVLSAQFDKPSTSLSLSSSSFTPVTFSSSSHSENENKTRKAAVSMVNTTSSPASPVRTPVISRRRRNDLGELQSPEEIQLPSLTQVLERVSSSPSSADGSQSSRSPTPVNTSLPQQLSSHSLSQPPVSLSHTPISFSQTPHSVSLSLSQPPLSLSQPFSLSPAPSPRALSISHLLAAAAATSGSSSEETLSLTELPPHLRTPSLDSRSTPLSFNLSSTFKTPAPPTSAFSLSLSLSPCLATSPAEFIPLPSLSPPPLPLPSTTQKSRSATSSLSVAKKFSTQRSAASSSSSSEVGGSEGDDVQASKRGSLELTCRHVLLGLEKQSAELAKAHNRTLSVSSSLSPSLSSSLSSSPSPVIKFQAATLSKEVNEVRRRVYDVLPILECLGIVSRLGRVYSYLGIERMCHTIVWVKQCVDFAKRWALGLESPLEKLKIKLTEDQRRRAAGRMIALVIASCPMWTNCTSEDEKDKSHSNTSSLKAKREKERKKDPKAKKDSTTVTTALIPPADLARLSFSSSSLTSSSLASSKPEAQGKTQVKATAPQGEPKILSSLTLQILVLLLLKDPVTVVPISDISGDIEFDPEMLFMGPDSSVNCTRLRLQFVKAAPAPVIIPGKKPGKVTNTGQDSSSSSNKLSNVVGRRLYDVIGVLAGLGFVSTTRNPGRTRAEKSKTKCKVVSVNPALYSDVTVHKDSFLGFYVAKRGITDTTTSIYGNVIASKEAVGNSGTPETTGIVETPSRYLAMSPAPAVSQNKYQGKTQVRPKASDTPVVIIKRKAGSLVKTQVGLVKASSSKKRKVA